MAESSRLASVRPDLIAGLTLAAYLLPAGIGDASLAGLPAEAGLYACLFSGLVFWLAGAEMLACLHETLETRGVGFRLADARGEVRDAFRRIGFERTHGTLESGQTVGATLKKWAALGCLLAALLLPASAWAAQDAPSAPAPQTQAAQDPEADQMKPAAVTLEGEPVLWITAGVGPYTPAFRAERTSRRLREAVRDRSLRDPTVTVVEVEGSSEVRAGPHLLMVVTARDAASLGVARTSLAAQHARVLEDAIRAERLRYAPSTLIWSGGYGLVATVLFLAAVFVIVRITGGLRRWLARRLAPRSETLRVMQAEVLAGDRLDRTAGLIFGAVRLVAILLVFDLYLTYVLGLFPWTRAISHHLLDYVMSPVRALGAALVAYLPKLLFLVVIAAFVILATRIVSVFFRQVERGRLVFASFPAEWASPTNKIVRVLLIAFGLVVAFPYLPASNSPAFTGVSVFIGVLISLASSSALSNIMAGIVLTYTSAFRLGDRVKIGDAFGDITDTSLLATRIRTIKNEEVTIPNGIVLGTAVINYTRECRTRGLILHTSITIGYDAPWRKVHDLMTDAAIATRGILADPKPFVWQTALNDFYVTYEINAYTATPQQMADIYAELHSRIQDSFYAAGVEIMSPHYTSLRDGNTVAIPEAQRPPGYQPASLRVQATSSDPA